MNLAALSNAYPSFQQAQSNIVQIEQARQALDANIFDLAQKKRQLDAAAAAIKPAQRRPAPSPNAGPTAPGVGGIPPLNLPQAGGMVPGTNIPISEGRPPSPGSIEPADAPPGSYQPPGYGNVAELPSFKPRPTQAPAAPAAAQESGGSYYDKSTDVLRQVIDEVRSANPGLDPQTLAMAVEQRLKLLDHIDPETKAAATTQMQLLQAQLRYLTQQQNADSMDAYRNRTAATGERNAATNEGRLGETSRHNETVEGQYKNGERGGGGGRVTPEKQLAEIDKLRAAAYNTFSTATSRLISPQDAQNQREALAATLKNLSAREAEIRASMAAAPAATPSPGKPKAAAPVTKKDKNGYTWQQVEGGWKRVK